MGKLLFPLSSLSGKLCLAVWRVSEDAHLFSVVKTSIYIFSYVERLQGQI
jgi:hypothetical protein